MTAQIFISYAHADDQLLDEGTFGWVTYFVDKLQKAIGMQPGGSQVNCWMDHQLEEQRAVDETLRQSIRGSRCILAFMSPRYLESKWCQQEMATFVELVGGGAANNRVFLVELLPTKRTDWHPGIQGISAIKFWSASLAEPEPMILGWPVPDTKVDKPYWRELNHLASILARQIQNLPPIPGNPPPEPVQPPATAKLVWVADPADDALDCWEALAATLRSHGHRVLPRFPGDYPYHDETLYRQALNADLAQADSLVQLLGGFPGRKPVWADARFTQLQADAAQAEARRRSVARHTWRRPDIALETIADPAYQALLAGATAEAFEAFCRLVVDGLSLPPAEAPASEQLSVVVNADTPDRELGKQAQAALDALEVVATLAAEPSPNQPPAQYRQHLEEQLQYSDGVLIVYGLAPPSWVQSQHAWAHKVLARCRKGVWGALLDGPPEDKLDHGLSQRSLMLLDCRQGLRPDPLKRFIDTLRREVGRV